MTLDNVSCNFLPGLTQLKRELDKKNLPLSRPIASVSLNPTYRDFTTFVRPSIILRAMLVVETIIFSAWLRRSVRLRELGGLYADPFSLRSTYFECAFFVRLY